jgi:hypothetical protein
MAYGKAYLIKKNDFDTKLKSAHCHPAVKQLRFDEQPFYH